MNAPLVSVVIATYRREAQLQKALESLARQTYKNVEIILVDDNDDSEWNTRVQKIVQQFRICQPQLSLELIVNHPNRGSAKARNVGIDAANGVYLTFLDDDDLYLPEKIEKQVEALVKAKADFCITDLELYNEEDKLVDRRIRKYIRTTNPEDLLRYHLMFHMTGTDTMMFRKEYLDQIGGFPPVDVGDEFYLMMEAITGGGEFYYLPGCDVKAYVHPEGGGISSGIHKIEGENRLHQYKQKYFDRIDAKSRRYIRMRHHAVLAFAELRRRKYAPALLEGTKSFLNAPIACFGMLCEKMMR